MCARVLVIDDDPVNLDLMTYLLNAFGHTPVAAGGGDRAKTNKAVFGLSITGGIIGNFTINSTGDTNLTPITIYKQVGKKLVPQKTLIPAANLVG